MVLLNECENSAGDEYKHEEINRRTRAPKKTFLFTREKFKMFVPTRETGQDGRSKNKMFTST